MSLIKQLLKINILVQISWKMASFCIKDWMVVSKFLWSPTRRRMCLFALQRSDWEAWNDQISKVWIVSFTSEVVLRFCKNCIFSSPFFEIQKACVFVSSILRNFNCFWVTKYVKAVVNMVLFCSPSCDKTKISMICCCNRFPNWLKITFGTVFH